MQWQPKMKRCKCCGSQFFAELPSKMYCSEECNKAFYRATEVYLINVKKARQRRKDEHAKPCTICGKRLDDARKTVHNECAEEVMVNEYPKFSKSTKRYMNNHGYTKEDVEVIIYERDYREYNKAI